MQDPPVRTEQAQSISYLLYEKIEPELVYKNSFQFSKAGIWLINLRNLGDQDMYACIQLGKPAKALTLFSKTLLNIRRKKDKML